MADFVEKILDFSRESIDRRRVFAYNIRMSVSTKRKKARLALRILLPCACLVWLAFIFSNSMRTGTQSSAQSSTVVTLLQRAVGWIFPDGWIANATGEDYLRLHAFIRKTAHFVEYAVLGGLLFGCYAVYARGFKGSLLPLLGVLLFPVLDEWLQTRVAGRAGMLADVLLDIGGGLFGLILVALPWVITKIKRSKYGRKELRNRPR